MKINRDIKIYHEHVVVTELRPGDMYMTTTFEHRARVVFHSVLVICIDDAGFTALKPGSMTLHRFNFVIGRNNYSTASVDRLIV